MNLLFKANHTDRFRYSDRVTFIFCLHRVCPRSKKSTLKGQTDWTRLNARFIYLGDGGDNQIIFLQFSFADLCHQNLDLTWHFSCEKNRNVIASMSHFNLMIQQMNHFSTNFFLFFSKCFNGNAIPSAFSNLCLHISLIHTCWMPKNRETARAKISSLNATHLHFFDYLTQFSFASPHLMSEFQPFLTVH